MIMGNDARDVDRLLGDYALELTGLAERAEIAGRTAEARALRDRQSEVAAVRARLRGGGGKLMEVNINIAPSAIIGIPLIAGLTTFATFAGWYLAMALFG